MIMQKFDADLPIPVVYSADRLDAHLDVWRWQWAEENEVAIGENWRSKLAEKPKMFDGKVLLAYDVQFGGREIRSRYFEANFSQLLGWRDLGYPDRSVWNGFAAAALRGSDGGYLCGVMAEHTANAGRVYFPAGTPDREDCRFDGSVDLAGSILRELAEETGLDVGFRVEPTWHVVCCWPTLAHIRILQCDDRTDVVARRIQDFIGSQNEPELSGVRTVYGCEDIDPATMPQYLRVFFKNQFLNLR